MEITQSLRAQRDEILKIALRHGASNVRVFGSIARGEADEASDVDLLGDMDPGRTLFDLGGLNAELEALLRRRVDLVTPRGLRVRMRERVWREARPL